MIELRLITGVFFAQKILQVLNAATRSSLFNLNLIWDRNLQFGQFKGI
jgi:hypothetical protein